MNCVCVCFMFTHTHTKMKMIKKSNLKISIFALPRCFDKKQWFPPGRSVWCNNQTGGPTARPSSVKGGQLCCRTGDFCNKQLRPHVIDYSQSPHSIFDKGDVEVFWLRFYLLSFFFSLFLFWTFYSSQYVLNEPLSILSWKLKLFQNNNFPNFFYLFSFINRFVTFCVFSLTILIWPLFANSPATSIFSVVFSINK